jgi:tetratricopeptide (TPR) repeat protein
MENQIQLLQEIRSALWILVYLVSAGVAVYVLKAFSALYKVLKSRWDDLFRCTASVLFDGAQYEKCIEFCREQLKKHPGKKLQTGYAYWYLGKAYFQIKNFDEALENFNKVIEIYPSWKQEWVDPYLEKIESWRKAQHGSV